MSSLFDDRPETARRGWRPPDTNLADLFDSLEEYYTELFTRTVGEAVAVELYGLTVDQLLEVERQVVIMHPRNYKRLPGADVFRKIVVNLPPPKVTPDLTRPALTDGMEPETARSLSEIVFAIGHEWQRKGIAFTADELLRTAKQRLRERTAS